MSTAATRTRKPLLQLGLSPEKGNEIIALVLSFAVVLLTICLLSYHPLDPSVLHRVAEEDAATRNLVGPVGAQLAALCFSFLGFTSLLLPAVLAVAAWRRWRGRETSTGVARGLGMLALLPSLPAMLQLLLGEIPWRGELLDAGGAIGVVVTQMLTARLNFGGAFLVLLAVLLVGGNLAVQSTLKDFFQALEAGLGTLREKGLLAWAQRRKRRQDESARRRVVRQLEDARGEGRRPAAQESSKLDLQLRADAPPLRVIERKGEGRFGVRRIPAPGRTPGGRTPGGRTPEGREAPEATPKTTPASAPGVSAAPVPAAGVPAARGPAKPAARQQVLGFQPEELAPVELPPVNLMRTDRQAKHHDEKDLLERGEVIREAFEHFGIEGSIEGISPGPVITVYEFQPAPGIKVSRIVNLQDDLALALKAESVRIERLPGRSTLGIEVPNKIRHLIRLGELLDHDKFRRAPSVLTMALGVDIYGRPYYADLASMPHLLVAGATGAGKSVGLQSMITSILYKAGRDQVQFIFIDPKRIELGVYAKIPHLKTEVVVEPKKAANGLRWAVAEMERRYRLLAEVHVRNIDHYNRAIRDPQERQRLALRDGESDLQADDWKPLPFYVIVIDELADLMIVASSEVETSIARLAQMARAVGIHLIVATQRPSVDVLTGTIKANFPCRLSYATATRHDSRTILDGIGAEKLLGKGDALFVPPGTSRIVRLHGAYVTEQETAGLVRWLKRRGKPDLDLDILKDPEGKAAGGDAGNGDDELFDEAARLVVLERQASASYLQRRLRIGFSRAARLIDMMAADGLLGPAQGSKPREVLVKQDYFEEIDRVAGDRAKQGV